MSHLSLPFESRYWLLKKLFDVYERSIREPEEFWAEQARKPVVPTGNTILQAEDQIIAVTTPESEEALRTALRGD